MQKITGALIWYYYNCSKESLAYGSWVKSIDLKKALSLKSAGSSSRMPIEKASKKHINKL